MKRRPFNQATSVIQAFNRGRSDGRRRTKSLSAVPYKDRRMAEAWERGFRSVREVSWQN
jgi:hypothetical protein